jgi:hypothetical protein
MQRPRRRCVNGKRGEDENQKPKTPKFLEISIRFQKIVQPILYATSNINGVLVFWFDALLIPHLLLFQHHCPDGIAPLPRLHSYRQFGDVDPL